MSDFVISLCVSVCVLVAQLCLALCDPMDCSCQTPLSVGFSKQEYWSGLSFPSPGALPNRNPTHTSNIGRQVLQQCATWKAQDLA